MSMLLVYSVNESKLRYRVLRKSFDCYLSTQNNIFILKKIENKW